MATLTTVSSNYGTINGIQKDGYSVFRGIPFAKVPTGALRFAPPQKPVYEWASLEYVLQ